LQELSDQVFPDVPPVALWRQSVERLARAVPAARSSPCMQVARSSTMIHESQRRPGGTGTPAHAGVSCGSDRLRGPFFPLRLEAPDKSSGGSRPGAQPKGVQLPGLQVARQQQGLSQAELAALAGVNEKTISRLERGGRAYYVTLERLAQALRVSRQRLLRPPP